MKLFSRTLGFLLVGNMAFGLDSGSATEDSTIIKAAKERTYPGGRDEEDLEVKPQVTKPTRKMGNVQQNTEAPSSDDEF